MPEKEETKKQEEPQEVTEQDIDAGKSYKATVEYGGKQFTPHRLSIGEKIKVARIKAQKLGNTPPDSIDEYTEALAYMSAWLDVALTARDNPEWTGADNIFDDNYLIKLHTKCWEAVEKKFFRTSEKQPS